MCLVVIILDSPALKHLTLSPLYSRCSFFLFCSKDADRLTQMALPLPQWPLLSLISKFISLLESCFATKSLSSLGIRSLTLSQKFYHIQLQIFHIIGERKYLILKSHCTPNLPISNVELAKPI